MLLPKMLFRCDPPEVLYPTEKRTENDGLIGVYHSFSPGNSLKWVISAK